MLGDLFILAFIALIVFIFNIVLLLIENKHNNE